MRSRWPRTRESWPLTSIRGCAGGFAGMPRSTTSAIGCWRSGPGRRPSRSLAVRGSISIRIAGHSATAGPVRSRITRPAPHRGSRSSGASPPVRSSSARPPTSRRISPVPGFEIELISLRGECKEATVWFGELASCRRRATRLPEGVTWTDRDGRGRGRETRRQRRPGISALVVDLRPRPVADPRRAARRIRPGARARPGCRRGRLPDCGPTSSRPRSWPPSPCATSARWTSSTCGG